MIGPARSGTSLTMRVLNLLGVDVGYERHMIPPSPWNPKGFWEHLELGELNRRLLRVMGGNLLAPPTLPPGWEASEALATERERARGLFYEAFGGRAVWGWKCPHACLTVPFWHQLFPRMRYVICVRNPLDVVASISVGGDSGRERLLGLWARYVASALVHTAGLRRLLVFYEDYFDDWRRVAGRMADFIGRPGAVEEGGEAIRACIDEDLRHQRSSVKALVEDPDVSPPTSSLYLVLRSLGASQPEHGPVDPEMSAWVDAFARRLLEAQGVRLPAAATS